MMRNKGFTVGSAHNFIREVDLDECSEHDKGEFGSRSSFLFVYTHTHIIFNKPNPLVHLILGLGEDKGVKLNNWCLTIESTKRSIHGSG